MSSVQIRPHPAVLPAALGLLAAFLAIAPPARAEAPGFAFLLISAGARPSGLAGAGVTMTQGTEAQFWNAAGLTEVKGVQINASHFELYQGLRNDDFALGGRLLGGGVAASVRAFYSEPISETDETGTLIGSFGASDVQLALGYGRAFGGGFSAGGTFGLVRERLADLSAQTWSADLGGAWQPEGLKALRAGLALRNLGPAAAFTIDGVKGEPVPLPTTLQGGASYGWSFGGAGTLRAALEGEFVSGFPGVGILAAEYGIPFGMQLRGGYRFNDETVSYTLGLGLTVGVMRLEYAYVPTRTGIGDTQRFALNFQL